MKKFQALSAFVAILLCAATPAFAEKMKNAYIFTPDGERIGFLTARAMCEGDGLLATRTGEHKAGTLGCWTYNRVDTVITVRWKDGQEQRINALDVTFVMEDKTSQR